VRNRLIIFVKSARPGFVKTRLAKTLGPEAACAAYKILLNRVLENVSGLKDVVLCFSPDDGLEETTSRLRANWIAEPQGPGDLGKRLVRAFDSAFTDGFDRVVVIGSECPAVTEVDISDAWARLEKSEAVLGPATDGGYWLIGLKTRAPEIFDDLDWGTSRVLAQTVASLERTGRSYKLLRTLTDVDTEKEWNEFLRERES